MLYKGRYNGKDTDESIDRYTELLLIDRNNAPIAYDDIAMNFRRIVETKLSLDSRIDQELSMLECKKIEERMQAAQHAHEVAQRAHEEKLKLIDRESKLIELIVDMPSDFLHEELAEVKARLQAFQL